LLIRHIPMELQDKPIRIWALYVYGFISYKDLNEVWPLVPKTKYITERILIMSELFILAMIVAGALIIVAVILMLPHYTKDTVRNNITIIDTLNGLAVLDSNEEVLSGLKTHVYLASNEYLFGANSIAQSIGYVLKTRVDFLSDRSDLTDTEICLVSELSKLRILTDYFNWSIAPTLAIAKMNISCTDFTLIAKQGITVDEAKQYIGCVRMMYSAVLNRSHEVVGEEFSKVRDEFFKSSENILNELAPKYYELSSEFKRKKKLLDEFPKLVKSDEEFIYSEVFAIARLNGYISTEFLPDEKNDQRKNE